MDADEQRELGELEDARADHDADDDSDGDESMSPQTGGPGLTGLTPPD